MPTASEAISVETQLRPISAGRVRGGGTLGAKDGAVEPTGMYSRRVPIPRTRSAASQLSFSTNHPRRWAESSSKRSIRLWMRKDPIHALDRLCRERGVVPAGGGRCTLPWRVLIVVLLLSISPNTVCCRTDAWTWRPSRWPSQARERVLAVRISGERACGRPIPQKRESTKKGGKVAKPERVNHSLSF